MGRRSKLKRKQARAKQDVANNNDSDIIDVTFSDETAVEIDDVGRKSRIPVLKSTSDLSSYTGSLGSIVSSIMENATSSSRIPRPVVVYFNRSFESASETSVEKNAHTKIEAPPLAYCPIPTTYSPVVAPIAHGDEDITLVAEANGVELQLNMKTILSGTPINIEGIVIQ